MTSQVEFISFRFIKDAFKRRVKPELLQTVTVGQAAGKSGK